MKTVLGNVSLGSFSLFTLPHERVSESFIQNKIFNLLDLSSDTQDLVGTLFGFYSLLNAVRNVEECIVLILKSDYCRLSSATPPYSSTTSTWSAWPC